MPYVTVYAHDVRRAWRAMSNVVWLYSHETAELVEVAVGRLVILPFSQNSCSSLVEGIKLKVSLCRFAYQIG